MRMPLTFSSIFKTESELSSGLTSLLFSVFLRILVRSVSLTSTLTLLVSRLQRSFALPHFESPAHALVDASVNRTATSDSCFMAEVPFSGGDYNTGARRG